MTTKGTAVLFMYGPLVNYHDRVAPTEPEIHCSLRHKEYPLVSQIFTVLVTHDYLSIATEARPETLSA